MYANDERLDGNDFTLLRTCHELHIGDTPRSVMTKVTSTRRKNRLPGSLYGNLDPGNNDKLMISYSRERSHNYNMEAACSVLFEGEIHFFGGGFVKDYMFDHQHFVIEKQRSGQTVKMSKKEDLQVGFLYPLCSTLEITSSQSRWFKKDVVFICFDDNQEYSCHYYDGKLTKTADSEMRHSLGAMTKYNETLLAVGGSWNIFQSSDIMKQDENKNFTWTGLSNGLFPSGTEQRFRFTQGRMIYWHSLVTVESTDINEEYVILTGGFNDWQEPLENVFKFNGTWFLFGKLNKRRMNHSSIYWNGAVYVIGGQYYEGVGGGYEREENSYIYSDSYFSDSDDWSVQIGYENGMLVTPIDDPYKTKMEIWNISNSKDQFNSIENWSELFGWEWPHLFIVHDSFFPDY